MAAEIRVGDTVKYKGDEGTGKVKEVWNGKRARVEWSSGVEAWAPLHSLTRVQKGKES